MSRNQRFALLSTGRPFTPTMARPDGNIDVLARLQLIYCYPLRVFPPAVPPVTAAISDALAYGVALSDTPAYSVTLTDA